MKRILFSGGGTAGSVSPLLAIVDEIKSRSADIVHQPAGQPVNDFEFLWIGTRQGIERGMVEKEGIAFKSIFSGKLRRYFSWKNFTDIALLKLGFWQSFFIMLKWRPDLVISAGGFVSVPVVWAAWLLRVPCLIHQQDVRPGLANKLMAPFAKVITVTFEKSLEDYGKKAVWTGNPVRKRMTALPDAHFFQLKTGLPTLLIVGGGTGAMFINRLVADCIHDLLKLSQVIHVTGKNKSAHSAAPNDAASRPQQLIENYHSFEFLNVDQFSEAMQKADLVVTRAGLATLSELSFLGKPIIIIPIPGSHQEENARIFAGHGAAVALAQKNLTAEKFIKQIKNILSDPSKMFHLKNNISQIIRSHANKMVAKIVDEILVNN
ncbi:MAG: undecaprenyldiphospho-muramoylpentapeptide beta-N-acetylglucosaminyltransferase [Patescibacteria group bacterium]